MFYSYFTACSFKCYECENDDNGVNYNTSQCEIDQGKVDCGANSTCSRFHYISTRKGNVVKESRGCNNKYRCEEFRKFCKEGTVQQKEERGIKNCDVAVCCVSDGDTPCNSGFTAPISSGFTVSIDMVMIMLAVLCSLKIF